MSEKFTINDFNKLKDAIIQHNVEYKRKYHTWYKMIKKEHGKTIIDMSYTISMYPKYEKITDFITNKTYILQNGQLTILDYEGYNTIYILVVDGHFISKSDHPEKLWAFIADNYKLSIDYYGRMTKEEIIQREYTDSHEGNEFFIANVKNIETGKSININVYDVLYVDDYLDDSEVENAFNEYIDYCSKNT